MTEFSKTGQDLSNYITALRHASGYTQQEVASYLHITPSAYANYESNKRALSPSNLISLSRLYHRSANELLREASAHYDASVRSDSTD